MFSAQYNVLKKKWIILKNKGSQKKQIWDSNTAAKSCT
jgi:hypothetical protein